MNRLTFLVQNEVLPISLAADMSIHSMYRYPVAHNLHEVVACASAKDSFGLLGSNSRIYLAID